MAEKLLTDKQHRFIDEYLKDLNAKQAAIRAGYSEKTAASQGQRLLNNANVSKLIAQAIEARSERTQINADWLLTRLAEEATADVGDLYDERGLLKPVSEWPMIWRTGLVQGIEVEGQSEARVSKIKLSDRVKRLELIGKHIDVQAFQDRVKHEGGMVVDLQDLTGAKDG